MVPVAKVDMDFTINMSLTEGEARALEAVMGYGFEAFLDCLYKMGKHYLEPHEKDLQKLFNSRGQLISQLNRIDAARKAFFEDGQKPGS